MLYEQYSFVHTEREFSKTNTFDLFFSFVFIFLSRLINANKCELIHLNKNMKSKENCFKNFNDMKVILSKKKKNLQEMYVRDFRASILVCKDYKINTKTLKILVFLLILFSVYLHCAVMQQSFLPLVHLFFYLIYKH